MKVAGRAKLGAAFVLAVAASLAIAKTLAGFAAIIQPYLAIEYDFWFELGMVVGQVLFQWAVLWRHSLREKLRYAGVLVLVSSVGAVLLWPLLAWHRSSAVSLSAAVGYFFAVVAVMFVVHWRLVVRLALPKVLCATWVLYRLLLLFVIVRRP